MDQQSLHAWEAKCIQEEAPRCTAACPLHVDARKLCELTAKGRWNDAWALLARTMPLPSVLARICDAPCESACLRAERGGAVRIGALERFCARIADRTPPLRPLPSKNKNVAVLGAGLAGLSAAWELARKGFGVTVLGAPPQGLLATISEQALPAEILAADLERLRKLGALFSDAPGQGTDLPALLKENAALFLDPEVWPRSRHGLGQSDDLTLGTDQPGIFSGDLPEASALSPVLLASLGRRAANSMERFAQGASLAAGREKDGPYESRLYTNISEIAPLPSSLPADEASRDETAIKAEATRCLHCECLECVKNCAYLEHYGSYPKVYARRIFNNASMVMGTRQANTLVNSCMDCGLCEALCPGDFDMGALCLEARRDLVGIGKMPPSAHEFALRDMAFANGEKCRLAKPAPGKSSASLLFFPGCQLTASDPQAVKRAYEWLLSARPDAGLHLACCGAPALWAGQTGKHEAALAVLREEWTGLGSPEVVAACPTCLKTLSEALPDARIRSFWGFVRELGLPDNPLSPQRPLAVHDPCGSREDAGLHEDIRALLALLDVRAVEPKLTRDLTECCGYGGLLCEVDPALADTVAKRRGRAVEEDFATYCAMCRDRLARTGKRILHLFDLLFPGGEDADPAARPAPGYSARRENRARLKQSLLASLWKEESPAPEPFENIAVRFAEGVAERLDERRILLGDVQKTLLAAQQSGKRFANAENGHFLVRHRPVSVTYWVEYSPEGEYFLVHNAWSHRMRVAGLEGGDR
ncbi:pyridine nucleotide-disulfide oxidoreductase/dicluster-binding protein [Paucidesulfovibrio longus]|uniref:pyridine nucleotide-disulfide oxidoreductase/dicluster-binding protein n=1 Tax=Paucidesulfovibrio longus TaxID=889 RepID=UPI0003B48E8A|nr:pyridine nucleotide-disulfide oxidoreductase/dicluster-binding protein [Paucidesulfovibrio longus]